MASILSDIKKMLGPDTDEVFDQEIIIHINAALATLAQIGACNEDAEITGTETWDDVFSNPAAAKKSKTYIYYKTRLGFDPPQSSYAIESMKALADEELWRINDFVDRGSIEKGETRFELLP